MERNLYPSHHAAATKNKFEVQKNLNKLTARNFNICYIKTTNKHVTTTMTTTTTGERWRRCEVLTTSPRDQTNTLLWSRNQKLN